MTYVNLLGLSLIPLCAISFAACAPKTASPVKSGYTELPSSSFDQYFIVEPTKTSKAETQKILDEYDIFKTMEEDVSYTVNVEDDGTIRITDFTTKDDVNMTIEALTLSGLTKQDDVISFDKFALSGLSLDEPNESVTMKLDTLILTGPVSFPSNLEEVDPETLLEDGAFSFSGLKVGGFSVKASEHDIEYTVDQSLIGIDKAAKTASFKTSGLSFTGNTPETGPISGGVKDIHVLNFDYSIFEDFMKYGMALERQATLSDPDAIPEIPEIPKISMFKKMFDHYGMKDASLKMDFVDINLPKAYGHASETGDIIHQTSTMEPLTIALLKAPPEPEVENVWAAFKNNGLGTFTLRSHTRSQMDKSKDIARVDDAEFSINDDLTISGQYEIKGLKALEEQMNSMDPTAEYDPTDFMAAYRGLSLTALDMQLSQTTFIDKVLAVAAEIQGTTPEVVKTQAKAPFAMLPAIAQTDLQKALATQTVEAMMAFLDEGKTVTIRMDSKKPIDAKTVEALTADTLTAEELGIVIKAE